MPRPLKCRTICVLPENTSFKPDKCSGRETVFMTLDEYESIRLMDYESLTQEAAAERLNVARTTAQAIYSSARKKLADCLVNGKALRIEGGQIEVCSGKKGCDIRSCPCKNRK